MFSLWDLILDIAIAQLQRIINVEDTTVAMATVCAVVPDLPNPNKPANIRALSIRAMMEILDPAI